MNESRASHGGAPVPEGSQKGGVNGVSVVHVEVVPAAFGGEVVEPQSQDRVWPGRHTQREDLRQEADPKQPDGGLRHILRPDASRRRAQEERR